MRRPSQIQSNQPSPTLPGAGSGSKAPVPGAKAAAAAAVPGAKTAVPAPTKGRPGKPQVDVREWVSGMRLSRFMVIMLSLVVLGAWVLIPTLGTYIDQRQRIAAAEVAVVATAEQISQLKQERARYEDPSFIVAQARERLFYVMPGEVVYLIDNDVEPAELPLVAQPVSEAIAQAPNDWMARLLRSVVTAGLSASVVPAVSEAE